MRVLLVYLSGSGLAVIDSVSNIRKAKMSRVKHEGLLG